MTSLKSFIKAIRAAKTIADERAVIQKESAAIRTSFREDYSDNKVRRQNVAKLLYLFTLGERTHFGQVECLKLLATSKFSDKRLGYLGTMLLLDENQEVLTLVTNSLSNDLSHPNQYVVALALCTLANIASTEMGRDLFADIEKILSSSNPYLKKKAALCAMRITRRVPELEEVFVDKAKLLVNDKNHGVLLCGISLIHDLCDNNPETMVPQFRPLVPKLIKNLKVLSTSGYAPEHDVAGVSDPFLQVKIIRLLGLLGAGDAQASEQMSDILAQIASNTDSSKNVGNAVLYETVLTIFGIEADSGLRVLGVNILGKFLSTRDNNTRYVALNTLLKVIDIEPTAVQRHRATIIECLQDVDISIRRRALELSFALINDQNTRVLIRELLAFLETADSEFKTNIISQIALAAEKYAPNSRWHIDTILRALKLAGAYAKENVLSSFITLVISSGEELQLYTVQKLYSALKKDISQEGLTLVGVWLIGEYANNLLKGGSYEEEELVQQVTEEDIVQLFENIINSLYATEVVREYVVNALMKLTVRFSSAAQIERIRLILQANASSLNVEVQQRVAEYNVLFGYDSVRRGVLEKMPPPEIREDLSKQAEKAKAHKKTARIPASHGSTTASAPSDVDLLLDLTGDSPSNGTTATNSAATTDLLSDIFGSSGNASAAANTGSANTGSAADLLSGLGGSSGPTSATPPAAKSANQNILDLFGSGPSPSPGTPPATATTASDLMNHVPADAYEAYNNNSLRLSFQPRKETPGSVTITATFQNTGSSPISDLVLQVAVPKSQKLQLQALSSSTVTPGQTARQLMKVSGAPNTNVRLRLRIAYSVNGGEVKEQVDFNKFPPALL
ncbi:Apl4p [Sugiyamaella lignohabitans]|uniref:AP-1 complex subunit gamma n=1 Tax=Sugiyamaella lignohabitans TaxID=796027 RepID=A0A167D6M7_9ASCO|nr:Apl4p [Sugiyamaella lignohabitans]ANB12545.1 Apl4p [Sugiyamaella lignohabitans]